MSTDPIAVQVVRGGVVESRHRVAAAVAEPGGRIVHATGDVETPTFPRSSVKPIQALALIESGAADAFAVSPDELALACASHGGEPMHVDRVRAWLARIGLDEGALACGAHPPTHKESARALRVAGGAPTAVHNNCSGKHTGMLTTALHTGAPVAGYLEPSHPVQERIRGLFEELTGRPVATPAVDGCGVPNWPMGIGALASAMANLVDRGPAAQRVFEAMRSHPELVAGTGRLCAALMSARPDIVAKTGAEGVFIAVLPEQRLAVALKVEDGAGRAAQVALLALLDHLVGGIADEPRLRSFAVAPVLNVAGRPVGEVRPAPSWPGF